MMQCGLCGAHLERDPPCRCGWRMRELLMRSQLRQAVAADPMLKDELSDAEWRWLFGDKPRD